VLSDSRSTPGQASGRQVPDAAESGYRTSDSAPRPDAQPQPSRRRANRPPRI